MIHRALTVLFVPAFLAPALFSQAAPEAAAPAPPVATAPAADAPAPVTYTVTPGTRIPLSLINSVSTKHAAPGDRLYLETVFPILVDGRIIIPPGSYVAGSVTAVKRAGRIKGRAELYVRFDSLTLPNGVTRDFRARLGSLDGQASEDLDREEGKIKGAGSKGEDMRTVAEATATGASVGGIAGSISGSPVRGLGLGAAGGAAAGLIAVLLTRGPDAVLTKGTTVEMVVDRPLVYADGEVMSGPLPIRTRAIGEGASPVPANNRSTGGLGRRFPL